MRRAMAVLAAVIVIAETSAHAADTMLDLAGDWYAQFIFSKATFGQSFLVESPVCAYSQPTVAGCTGGTRGAQQCASGLTTPTALFNTTDPPDHCPVICPGGNASGGQNEITCFAQNEVNLFQLFLGNYSAGQMLQSRLDVDTNRDGQIVLPPDLQWHSDPSKDNDLMTDGTPFDHLRTTSLGSGAIRLEWEDKPFAVSDFDFNDGVYMLLRYPGPGFPAPTFGFGNTIPAQPLYFVPKLDVDDVDFPGTRMLHLTISVYNESPNPATVGVCSMLNLHGLTNVPPSATCNPGQAETTPFCYFESCTGHDAIPTAAACTIDPTGPAGQQCTPRGPGRASDCDDPDVRFSLTDARFVGGAAPATEDLQVVQGAPASGGSGPPTVWAFSAPLNQFNPPIDGLSSSEIVHAILSSAEQIYADFFVLPPGDLQSLGLSHPFACPSGYNVDTHLMGHTKLPFFFAWTAPVTEINSPTTFQTSMRNEVTMQDPNPVQAHTEIVWREIDPRNPIGITYSAFPPPRQTFTMDPAVPSSGYGQVTFNFPSSVPEGFMGVGTQYTTDESTNKILVSQTMRSVKDTQPPKVEQVSVARDGQNRFALEVQASDAPATVASIKIQTFVDSVGPATRFMAFQGGNYQTTTAFGLNVPSVAPASVISMQALAADEVGNTVAVQLPVAHAGIDRAVECTSPAGAAVTFDSSRTTGVPPLSFQWAGPFGTASGAAPTRTLPKGTSAIGLTVADAKGFSSTDGVNILVRDTTPPVIVLPTVRSAAICGDGATITVGQATATDVCTAGPLTPTGQLIATNGVTLATPLPVVSGRVALKIGTNTIRWTVSDGTNTATADQTVTVSPKIETNGSFVLDDRAKVLDSAGGFGAVANAGSGTTQIGNDGRSGAILSKGPVNVLHRAIVNGNVVSASTVFKESDGSITGTITSGGTVVLPALPTLPTFPAPTLAGFTVNAGTSQTRPPGSYSSATVVNGGTLVLTAGDYFFQSLTINSGSTVRVSATTRVFVSNALTFNAPFRAGSGTALQAISLGFAGSNLSLLAPFNGTLVAPNASVSFGTGAGLTYTGSFFGRSFEITPASVLVCQVN